MAIAQQIAQTIFDKDMDAKDLIGCSDRLKDLCLRQYLLSMTKTQRAIFFTESTEVFDPLPYVGEEDGRFECDECELGKQVMSAMFITMDGRIGDDVASELLTLRKEHQREVAAMCDEAIQQIKGAAA